jgi:small subunit ribosomal protein S17
MTKTVVVQVDRLEKHAKYRKYYRMSTKFKAEDLKDGSKIGDVVIIEETRPLSKEKRWRVIERVSRIPDIVNEDDGENNKAEETS